MIDGFLELTLRMYSSFVYLRKECLEGVVNKTAVCSVSKQTKAIRQSVSLSLLSYLEVVC